MRVSKTLTMVAVMAAAAVALTSCSDDPSASAEADKARTESVEKIREKQPVKPMPYSPTLNTVSKWAEKWGQEGQVSYVYMQREDGSFAGYYVIDGLPVNYCVSTAPPYSMEDLPGDGSSNDKKVEAPTIDGAYYGNCDPTRYYGFSAVTGQYVEWTDGNVLTTVLSDQPLPLKNQPPALSVDSIEDVEKAKQ